MYSYLYWCWHWKPEEQSFLFWIDCNRFALNAKNTKRIHTKRKKDRFHINKIKLTRHDIQKWKHLVGIIDLICFCLHKNVEKKKIQWNHSGCLSMSWKNNELFVYWWKGKSIFFVVCFPLSAFYIENWCNISVCILVYIYFIRKHLNILNNFLLLWKRVGIYYII